MIILFYISGFVAVLTTICVIFNTNPVHALLYLITSLLSISLNLFTLKAPFVGAIETIIYAGAIMVLFIFAIMMLNINSTNLYYSYQESQFLSLKFCLGILLLMINLLIILLYIIFKTNNCFINILNPSISITQIGVALFDSYTLTIEIASFLLLSALISVLHIAQEQHVLIDSGYTYQSTRNKK